jgi:hypothetical protein
MTIHAAHMGGVRRVWAVGGPSESVRAWCRGQVRMERGRLPLDDVDYCDHPVLVAQGASVG